MSEQRTTYLMTSFLELLLGYKKSTLNFSVMPDGLVRESEEILRAHFFAPPQRLDVIKMFSRLFARGVAIYGLWQASTYSNL